MDSRQLECAVSGAVSGTVSGAVSGTVSGTVALVLRISRIVGAAPLRMRRRGDDWLISVSPKLSIYSIVLVSLLNIILIAGLFRDLYSNEEQSLRIVIFTDHPIKSIMWIADILMLLIISSVAVGGAPARLKHMIHCFNQMQMTNSRLENYAPRENLKRKKCIPVILFILLTATVNLLTVFFVIYETYYVFNKDWTIPLMYMSFNLLFIITALSEMQFIAVVLMLNSSLKAVNDPLAHLLNIMNLQDKSDFKQVSTIGANSSSTSKIMSASRPVKPVSVVFESIPVLGKNINSDYYNLSSYTSRMAYETVRHLALSHSLICDIVRKINKSNGLLLILVLVSLLLHLVITAYNFLYAVSNQTMMSVNISIQLCWFFLHISNMVIMMEPCHRTQEEMDRTRVLVCKLIRHVTCSTDPLSTELDLFARQLVLNQAKFTPLGIFTFGRPLIASILGGVTTYSVIIIQFQRVSDEHFRAK